MTTPARSEKPVANTGQLVPQPHGGAIKRGGSPGRKPQAFRVSQLRRAIRNAEVIDAMVKGVALDIQEDGSYKLVKVAHMVRAKAFELQQTAGLGGKLDTEQVRRCLAGQVRVIRDIVPEEQYPGLAELILAALAEVWGA